MRTVLFAWIVCAFAGCGKSPQERTVDVFNKIADALEGVTDEASAQAAMKKIESLKSEMEAIGRDMQDSTADLSEDFAKDMGAAVQRAAKEMMRIQKNHPEAAKALEKAMSDFKGR